MTKINVADATDKVLDWLAATCEGWDSYDVHTDGAFELERTATGDCMWLRCYTPTTDWAQGGPIIERERIGTWPSDSIEGMWAARPDYEVYPDRLPPAYGPTPLIAALRCYVASKLGEEVEVPDELA